MTAFRISSIGEPTEESTFTVESQSGIDYALATNDPIEQHREGTLIPPIYMVVPVWEKVFEVVNKIVPEEHFFSVVHGEQDMFFHRPLNAGMTLRSFAVGESVSVKDSGTTLVVKTQSLDDATGELVVEQYFTMFFRGVDGQYNAGTPHDTGLDLVEYETITTSNGDNSALVSSTNAHIDDDQTIRYAQASGDFMPIHIDDDFAKSVGLPGIIVHGLCTMAHASWAAIQGVAGSNPTRLKRIAVRFSKPLRPGDDITTRIYSCESLAASTGAIQYYLSLQRDLDHEKILTNSLVEIDL